MLSLWSILLVCSLEMICVLGQSQFTLTVTLLSYENADNRDTSGECCRSNCRRCDNEFTFCAQQNSESILCDYGMMSFEQPSNSMINFQGSTNQNLRFSSTSRQWPGEFALSVNVFNREILVDSFTIGRSTFLPGEMLTETLTGENDPTNTLALSVSVTCADGFSGPNCAAVPTTTQAITNAPTTQDISSIPTTDAITTNIPTSTPRATTNAPAETNEPTTTANMVPTMESPMTTENVQDATTGVSDSTMDGGGAQARGLSEGGVAGIVIVFLIGAVLSVVAVIALIWFYRNKKSNSFASYDPSKNQVVDNPNYSLVELNTDPASSNVSPAPVYQTTHLNQHTLDNSNPLYLESANEDYSVPLDCYPPSKPTRADEADYDIVQGLPPLPSQPPPPPHALNTLTNSNEDYALPPDAFTSSAKVPQIEEPDYDLPPDEKEQSNSPSNQRLLPHSASAGSLGNSLNPYGEYSDGTIKRVASQQSVDKELFDNAEYALPSTLELSS